MCAPATTTTTTKLNVVEAPVSVNTAITIAGTTTKQQQKQQQKQKRRKRTVSFDSFVKVKFCLHFNDYTKEEHQQTWTTENETKAIRRSNQMVATEFSRPNAPTEGNSMSVNGVDCLRGLECRTRKGAARRKRNKANARYAVLEEQHFQKQHNNENDTSTRFEPASSLLDDNTDALANIYCEYTEGSQIEAHTMGLRDQAEAGVVEAAATLAMPSSLPLPAQPEKESPSSTKPVSSSVITTIPNTNTNTNTESFRKRKPLFLSSTCGDSTKSLHRLPVLTSSRRVLLTNKFFKV